MDWLLPAATGALDEAEDALRTLFRDPELVRETVVNPQFVNATPVFAGFQLDAVGSVAPGDEIAIIGRCREPDNWLLVWFSTFVGDIRQG